MFDQIDGQVVFVPIDWEALRVDRKAWDEDCMPDEIIRLDEWTQFYLFGATNDDN